ncbi:MAG: hypothetical protein NW203_01970 [Hyphomonadaceae bacterium]|nr:hypothetical protein [Hyphomonadaceae bacterium]
MEDEAAADSAPGAPYHIDIQRVIAKTTAFNPTRAAAALWFGMVTELGEQSAEAIDRWAQSLLASLSEASDRLGAGEAVEAERQAKAIAAMVKALKDIAELRAYARTLPTEESIDDAREEMADRVVRWLEADRGADLLSKRPETSGGEASP